MADDIKSLAARVQKLETSMKGTDQSITELERKGNYLKDILDNINDLRQRMDSAEKKLADIHNRLARQSP